MAVQGLMMLSEGETYCWLLATRILLAGQRGNKVMDGVGEEEGESKINEGTGEEEEQEEEESEQEDASEELVFAAVVVVKRDEAVVVVHLVGEEAAAVVPLWWTYGSSAILF